MYVKRNLGLLPVLRGTWKELAFFIIWSSLVFFLYYNLEWTFISLAIEPLSIIGIAVSFYLGFKNSQSYDRFWEARKLWGAIVNYSRTWGMQVLSFVKDAPEDQRILIYRHLAWINALRVQLRQPTSFSLDRSKSLKRHIEGYRAYGTIADIIQPFVSAGELANLKDRKNTATHLVKNQGLHLKELLQDGKINEFQNLMLQKVLEENYNFQGACERIKNTPFPRQYAYYGTIFAWIFVLLLPFGLLNAFDEEFLKLSHSGIIWLETAAILLSVLISWIFITIDRVAKNSEDPFEGRFNDVPMTAICKTIEIDLKDMLDEDPLPEKVAPINNILY
ncbi:MAG: bestrophin family protein [Robiginitalea sp.]|jgi:putative membrane protein